MKEKEHNCMDEIYEAERIGRASYQCRTCKKDVSVAYFYFQEAISAHPKKAGKGKV